MATPQTKEDVIIDQNYDGYTDTNHEVWGILYERQLKQLPGMVDPLFLEGVDKCGFVKEQIPRFDEVNIHLNKATGWKIVPVPGLIDDKIFFNMLLEKIFPVTAWIRKPEEIDYLEEPDMFHDVFGHVPLLTNQNYVGFLSALAEIALKFINNRWAIELLSRLYWYTIEFGLIEREEGLRIYGAGILSSSKEVEYSLRDRDVPRLDYIPENILKTPYFKHDLQVRYFVIQGYENLYKSIPEVERALQHILDTVYAPPAFDEQFA